MPHIMRGTQLVRKVRFHIESNTGAHCAPTGFGLINFFGRLCAQHNVRRCICVTNQILCGARKKICGSEFLSRETGCSVTLHVYVLQIRYSVKRKYACGGSPLNIWNNCTPAMYTIIYMYTILYTELCQ